MPKSDTPTVLAVVINYNYGRFLGECLQSIEEQTSGAVDILVVDDASTDESLAVVQQWSSTRGRSLHLVAKETNRGPADSYNAALRFIRAHDYDFVGFLDADDLWEPSKVERQLGAFAEVDACVAVVYSDYDEFGTGVEGRSVTSAEPSNAIEQLLRGGAFLALNTGLIRAGALRAIDPLRTDLRVCDLQLWLELARHGTFAKVPELLARVRIHGTSMSRSERLAGDRLIILGNHAKTARERVCARERGRRLLRSYVTLTDQVSVRPVFSYGRGCRDPLVFPVAAAKGVQALRRAVRSSLTAFPPAWRTHTPTS